MNKFSTVIGVDPDTEKHGIATYTDEKLESLQNLNTIEIVEKFRFLNDAVFSIENTLANNFIYGRNRTKNNLVNQKIMLNVGRCQQSQIELMRWLDYYGMPYILNAPAKGNWANNEEQFKRITGWSKRSNKDTRSAAYFGYLALRQH
jgi:hypothetical protein